MTLHITENIELEKNTVKILVVHYSYNIKLKNEKNSGIMQKVEAVLNIWRMRNLTLEAKIKIFERLAFSFLAQVGSGILCL